MDAGGVVAAAENGQALAMGSEAPAEASAGLACSALSDVGQIGACAEQRRD
jgi:hypothetical protein